MTENTENIIPITYRNWLHGIPPRRIKLDIDGWAGANSWAVPQPWHCKPYADANTYGLELLYTWQAPCTVTCDEHGMCSFDGNYEQEKPDYLGKDWYPFACFAPYHFGFVSMVDIKTPPGHNLMVMPHPRFYSDKDGSTPCAVPGQLEMDWWPEIFFIVFKAPAVGQKLVFKHGDPVAQFMVVPRNIKYDIKTMPDEEATVRAERQNALEKNWNRMCTRVFYCKDDPGCEKDNFFDNKYKVLSQMARRDGLKAVEKIMDNPKSIPHWHENPQVIDSRDPKDQIPQHNPWSAEDVAAAKKKKEMKKEMKAVKKNEDRQTKREAQAKKLEEQISLTNEDLEQMYGPELLNQVDQILDKPEATEADLDQLITSFKREKRLKRIERTNKVKSQCDPKKAVMANQGVPKPPPEVKPKKKDDGEYVLGYKIEKLL